MKSCFEHSGSSRHRLNNWCEQLRSSPSYLPKKKFNSVDSFLISAQSYISSERWSKVDQVGDRKTAQTWVGEDLATIDTEDFENEVGSYGRPGARWLKSRWGGGRRRCTLDGWWSVWPRVHRATCWRMTNGHGLPPAFTRFGTVDDDPFRP